MNNTHNIHNPNDQAEPRQTSGANNPATEANNKGTAPAVGSGALFGDTQGNILRRESRNKRDAARRALVDLKTLEEALGEYIASCEIAQYKKMQYPAKIEMQVKQLIYTISETTLDDILR